jgi:hypothetical protein
MQLAPVKRVSLTFADRGLSSSSFSLSLAPRLQAAASVPKWAQNAFKAAATSDGKKQEQPAASAPDQIPLIVQAGKMSKGLRVSVKPNDTVSSLKEWLRIEKDYDDQWLLLPFRLKDRQLDDRQKWGFYLPEDAKASWELETPVLQMVMRVGYDKSWVYENHKGLAAFQCAIAHSCCQS